MEKAALLSLQSPTELGERRAKWLLLLLAGIFLPIGTGNPCSVSHIKPSFLKNNPQMFCVLKS